MARPLRARRRVFANGSGRLSTGIRSLYARKPRRLRTTYGQHGEVKVIKPATRDIDGRPLDGVTS